MSRDQPTTTQYLPSSTTTAVAPGSTASTSASSYFSPISRSQHRRGSSSHPPPSPTVTSVSNAVSPSPPANAAAHHPDFQRAPPTQSPASPTRSAFFFSSSPHTFWKRSSSGDQATTQQKRGKDGSTAQISTASFTEPLHGPNTSQEDLPGGNNESTSHTSLSSSISSALRPSSSRSYPSKVPSRLNDSTSSLDSNGGTSTRIQITEEPQSIPTTVVPLLPAPKKKSLSLKLSIRRQAHLSTRQNSVESDGGVSTGSDSQSTSPRLRSAHKTSQSSLTSGDLRSGEQGVQPSLVAPSSSMQLSLTQVHTATPLPQQRTATPPPQHRTSTPPPQHRTSTPPPPLPPPPHNTATIRTISRSNSPMPQTPAHPAPSISPPPPSSSLHTGVAIGTNPNATVTTGSGAGARDQHPTPPLPRSMTSSPTPYQQAKNDVIETKAVFKVYDPTTGNKTINNYMIIKEVGRGVHGKVKLAEDVETGELVAIKIVDKQSRRRQLGLARANSSSGIPNNRSGPRIGMGSGSSNSGAPAPPSSNEQKIRREIAILKKCIHPHVVRLKEVIDDPTSKKIYMVLEYMEGGEIRWKDADDRPVMSIEEARRTFRDVVSGLEYLHYQGIIHRDIKPANLLWTKEHIVKISDFGVSYFNESLAAHPEEDPTRSNYHPASADDTHRIDRELAKTAGSPAFFAPELCYAGDVTLDAVAAAVLGRAPTPQHDTATPPNISQTSFIRTNTSTGNLPHAPRTPSTSSVSLLVPPSVAPTPSTSPSPSPTPSTARAASASPRPPRPRITKAIDIWALGVTLYCLVFGRCPFVAETEFELFNIIPSQPLKFPNREDVGGREADPSLKDLLFRLLEKDPEKRISLEEVKRHPWVTSDLGDPAAWIEETDPRKWKAVEVTEEELKSAVTMLGKLKNKIRKLSSSISNLTTGLSGFRRGRSKSISVTQPNVKEAFDMLPPLPTTITPSTSTSRIGSTSTSRTGPSSQPPSNPSAPISIPTQSQSIPSPIGTPTSYFFRPTSPAPTPILIQRGPTGILSQNPAGKMAIYGTSLPERSGGGALMFFHHQQRARAGPPPVRPRSATISEDGVDEVDDDTAENTRSSSPVPRTGRASPSPLFKSTPIQPIPEYNSRRVVFGIPAQQHRRSGDGWVIGSTSPGTYVGNTSTRASNSPMGLGTAGLEANRSSSSLNNVITAAPPPASAAASSTSVTGVTVRPKWVVGYGSESGMSGGEGEEGEGYASSTYSGSNHGGGSGSGSYFPGRLLRSRSSFGESIGWTAEEAEEGSGIGRERAEGVDGEEDEEAEDYFDAEDEDEADVEDEEGAYERWRRR